LKRFREDTYRAIAEGISLNPILHSFQRVVNNYGVEQELYDTFLDSMAMDLTDTAHDQSSYETYILGSAEVVGLMCLQVFMHGKTYSESEQEKLVLGARALGSAFQKVNFLRDLSADFKRLGRSYFPGVDVKSFNEETKQRLVDDIKVDLGVSAQSLPLLPKSARRAVAAAQLLFTTLNNQIEKTSATELINRRISVGSLRKASLLIRALIGAKV
jgi:phytoene/squalene synthetase